MHWLKLKWKLIGAVVHGVIFHMSFLQDLCADVLVITPWGEKSVTSEATAKV